MRRIVIEIGAGELLDRLTILELKARHARADAQRRLHAQLEELKVAAHEAGLLTALFDADVSELRSINEALWHTEDQIRGCEAAGDFGFRFVELARAIYTTNDQRARLKQRIDERYGSALEEEKIYSARRPA